MSASNPFTMFVACVVLPPNDSCQIIDWSSCDSFQSFAKFVVIFPYATYGLLYAASVRTGVSSGVQSDAFEAEDPPEPVLLEEPSLEHPAASRPNTASTKNGRRARRDRKIALLSRDRLEVELRLDLRWSGRS